MRLTVSASGLQRIFHRSRTPSPSLTTNDHSTNHDIVQNTSLINPREVDRLPRSGSGLFLSLPDTEDHNPQPSLSGPESNYLMGHLPTYEVSERGQVESEVYGIWVDMGRGIVVSCPSVPLRALGSVHQRAR